MVSQQMRSALITLIPSYITNRIWPEQRPRWKIHPTSYLDGLRGIASFIVFLCHFTENNHGYFTPTYGLNPESARGSSLIQLPYLRIIYSGRPMVHIFFIISGFVLSYRPLQAIRARDLEKCYTTVSSSAFRRPFRLFGPCIVSTFMIMILIQMGALYTPKETVWEQFTHWWSTVLRGITWPWEWDRGLFPDYDVHLWTIPIEFVHSMLLFMVIIAVCRLRPFIRRATVFLMLVYFIWASRWAAFEFIGGMFLADLHIKRDQSRKSFADFEEPVDDRKSVMKKILWILLHVSIFVAAGFISSWPNGDPDKTWGISYLWSHVPPSFSHEKDKQHPQKFWFAMSAMAVVWSCGEVPLLRRILESRASQYLGRTSYAVYIMHGPVLDSLQRYVVGHIAEAAKGEAGADGYRPEKPAVGFKGLIGTEGPNQRMLCWLTSLLVLGPVVMWAADVFWRLVDTPMVSAARKIETVCLDDKHEYEKVPNNGSGLV